MKNFIIPIAFLLCLFILSCQKEGNGFKLSENNVIEISPNEMSEFAISEYTKLDYKSSIEYVVLKNSPAELSSVEEVLANDELIICLDYPSDTNRKLYLFDRSGFYFKTILFSDLGIEFSDVKLTQDHIFVMDGYNRTITKFDFNGVRISQLDVALERMFDFTYQERNDQYVIHTPYVSSNEDNGVLNIVSGNNDFIDKWGVPETDGNQLFSTNGRYCNSINGDVYFRELGKGSIYHLDGSGNMNKIIEANIDDMGPELQGEVGSVPNANELIASQPFIRMFANDNYLALNRLTPEGYFTYFYDLSDQSILKIRKNIYLEHVEDQFDFFFPEIAGCSSDRFISFYSSEKYKRHLDFLNQVNDDASNMVGHLPYVGNQNDPVLMFFNI